MLWLGLVFKPAQIGPGIFMHTSNLASQWEVGSAGPGSTLHLSVSKALNGASSLPAPRGSTQGEGPTESKALCVPGHLSFLLINLPILVWSPTLVRGGRVGTAVKEKELMTVWGPEGWIQSDPKE